MAGLIFEFEPFRTTRSPRGPERGREQSSRVAAMASGAYAIDATGVHLTSMRVVSGEVVTRHMSHTGAARHYVGWADRRW